MSMHKVTVVRVGAPEVHPSADALELIKIWGYTAVVRKGEWHEGDLGIYVEPDYIVDSTRPEFAFLAEMLKHPPGPERIKVKRLRGVYSQGLLIHAAPGMAEGDDVMEALGIVRYEPPLQTQGGDNEPGPPGYRPVYDVESWRRYRHVLVEGEEVVLSEKLHGCNARFCCVNGRIYCGSRTAWKADDPKSVWWSALRQNPWIEAWCAAHPDITLYGEVFGQVQDHKYGARGGQAFFRVFDVLEGGRWWDEDERALEAKGQDLRLVPSLWRGPYSEAVVEQYTDGKTAIAGADHVREGIVIRPVKERTHPEIGRVILKSVSNAYLERA